MKKVLTLSFLTLISCSATPGPDKSATGAVLGAAWGAGAGAVVGNQINDIGPGAAIGAGFGAVGGLVSGAALDIAEGGELEQQRDLDALKIQVAANQRALLGLQNSLDEREQQINAAAFSEQIYFDEARASVRLGSVARLEKLADAIKQNPFVTTIEIHGHADDLGDVERNKQLSEARATTVANFLTNHGVSINQIQIVAHGAMNPVASNQSESGRQLNRRVEIFLRP